MRLYKDEETGYWTKLSHTWELGRVHSPEACVGRGCGIHDHPSDHPLSDAPMSWRADRNILERICEHGVGHPDADSADYLRSINRAFENIHGCDGCCTGLQFD